MNAEQLRTALSAMRADATTWMQVSDQLHRAATVADRLDLSAFHFTVIGDEAGLTEFYADLQRRMTGLLREAGARFDDLAVALRSAAAGYEEDDRAGAQQIHDVY